MNKPKQVVKDMALAFFNLYENYALIIKNIFFVHKTISKEWQNGSFYNKAERKSNFRIYFENLVWLLKNKEINLLYYAYSFDRKKDPVDQNEYISNLQFKRTRYKINKGKDYNYACILRDKLLFYDFVNGFSLKTPKIIAAGSFENIFLLGGGKKISIQEFLNMHQNRTFFCKDRTGECGKGVYKLSIDNSGVYINDAVSSIDRLTKIFLNIKDYVIQEKIEQHKDLARYHSTSVNTLRVITIKNRTGIYVFDAFLRLGMGDSVVDNVSAGGMLVGVDCSRGLTKEFGYKHSLRSKICY